MDFRDVQAVVGKAPDKDLSVYMKNYHDLLKTFKQRDEERTRSYEVFDRLASRLEEYEKKFHTFDIALIDDFMNKDDEYIFQQLVLGEQKKKTQPKIIKEKVEISLNYKFEEDPTPEPVSVWETIPITYKRIHNKKK